MGGFLPGNRVELLETGGEYFPALLAEIAAAARDIHLESYIFEDDDTGRRIAGALMDAARRGVRVRVLVDGFGARNFIDGLGQALETGGVEVLVYRPEVARLRLRRNRLRRLHRKLVVIDGRIAFVGGINIVNDADAPGESPRYDFAVRVEGPLLDEIHAAAHNVWRLVRWAGVRGRTDAGRLPPSAAVCGTTRAAFIIRDTFRHRRDIEDAYLAAIASARDEVVIASAYFLPGRRFRHALVDAARRGVRVNVLLQGRVEYLLLHYATQGLYGALLKAGIRIFEYHKGFLHAKVAVVDGRWATVGSSNIDPFSLLLAREANVVVQDDRFAGRLRESLQHAMDCGAVEVAAEDLRRRSVLANGFTWFAYGFVRLLIGITRYGDGDYRE